MPIDPRELYLGGGIVPGTTNFPPAPPAGGYATPRVHPAVNYPEIYPTGQYITGDVAGTPTRGEVWSPRQPPAGPSVAGGLFDRLNQFREQNPGVLARFGAGMMGSSPMAETFKDLGAYRAQQGNRQGIAEYLLRKGLVSSLEEGQLAAQNPAIMQSLFKDQTTMQAFDQRKQIADSIGLQEGSPEYQRYLATGQMGTGSSTGLPTSVEEYEYGLTHPEYAAQQKAIKSGAARGLSATEERLRAAAEEAVTPLETTLSSIDRAMELADSGLVVTGLGTGKGAEYAVATGPLGAAVGSALHMPPAKAAATLEFNNLLTGEAITRMATTLKGATTDTEMRQFINILANPATPIEEKRNTLKRMKQLAEGMHNTYTKRIQRYDAAEQGTGGVFDAPAPPEGGEDTGGWSSRKIEDAP